MSPEFAQNNTGTEDTHLSFVRKAETVFMSGAMVGGALGLASTKYLPVDVSLAEHINAKVSLTSQKGVTAQNSGDEFAVPNAPFSTSLPGMRGIKVNIVTGDVVEEVTHSVNNPKAVASLTKLVSEPKGGIVDPIVKGFAGRVGEGAAIGAFVLPVVLGAVAISHLRPIERTRNFIKKINSAPIGVRMLAYPTMAVGLTAPIVVTGKEIVQQQDSQGTPLPAWIANRSPMLSGATVKGTNLEQAINKVVASYDKGRSEWKIINANLETKIRQLDVKGELSFFDDPNIEVEQNQTGVLCNEPFMEIVEPTLQHNLPQDVLAETGDRSLKGNTWAYEHNCENTLFKDVNTKYLVGGTGNHDGQPNIWSLGPDHGYTKVVRGVTYITYPDPRSQRWGHPNPPLTQDILNKQIAVQGSIVAERACAITEKTHVPPDLVVHTPEEGFEAIIRGCANNVSSGHGIRHNDNKDTTHPIFRSYRALDGQIVQQLINVTASGSTDNKSNFSGPGKDGAEVYKLYSKPGHEFLRAVSFIFKKSGDVEVINTEKPSPAEPTTYMMNFVLRGSPTAKKVAQLMLGQNAAAKHKVAVIKHG